LVRTIDYGKATRVGLGPAAWKRPCPLPVAPPLRVGYDFAASFANHHLRWLWTRICTVPLNDAHDSTIATKVKIIQSSPLREICKDTRVIRAVLPLYYSYS
jgi:hypothetical protein